MEPSTFSLLHLGALGLILALTAGYGLFLKLRHPSPKAVLFVLSVLLTALEGWKIGYLQGMGSFSRYDLPLHLCSMGIPVFTLCSLRKSSRGYLLYLVFLPASVFALLFPGWIQTDLRDFRFLHGFLFHTLLLWGALTPSLTGTLRLRRSDSLKAMGVLLLLSAVVTPVNLHYNTNFLFLLQPPPLFPFHLSSGLLQTYPLILIALAAVLLLLLHVLYILTEHHRN